MYSTTILKICKEFTMKKSDDLLLKDLQKLLNIAILSDKDQKTLFFSLTDKGIMKLIDCFQSPNAKIRVLSFTFFTELIWNNEMIQNVLCEKYSFNPIGNIICINFLPDYFLKKIPLSADIIALIKQSQFISQKQSTKYWKWPDNPKYTDSIIPDPQRYLLGFYYCGNQPAISEGIKETDRGREQKIISVLEEGYEDVSIESFAGRKKEVMQENNDLIQQRSPLRNKREDYKKTRKKNASKSIDSTQPVGDKYINKHFK